MSVAKVRSDFGAGGFKVGAEAVRAGMVGKVRSYSAALTSLANVAPARLQLVARCRQARRAGSLAYDKCRLPAEPCLAGS